MKTSARKIVIPVVDLFAGPGGLGEGFARFPYKNPDESRYETRLSIEKDPRAHETLLLRSFVRQFSQSKLPDDYYGLLKRVELPLRQRMDQLFEKHPKHAGKANAESLRAELGNPEFESLISRSLARSVGDERDWVLLGGPPCQAYSLVGRSRNRGIKEYRPENDHRHFLYREYLKVIAEHLPSVFVMENVKGLLSATVRNEKIFDRIIQDLCNPRKGLGMNRAKPKGLESTYRLFALGASNSSANSNSIADTKKLEPSAFVIRMEEFGVPQARHRLIILGVREDLGIKELPLKLQRCDAVPACRVLDDLPRLRSGLSKETDLASTWCRRVAQSVQSDWYRSMDKKLVPVKRRIRETIRKIRADNLERGSDWAKSGHCPKYMADWFTDPKIGGVFNHETRGHITEDLHRYLFASCYAKVNGTPPSLKEFPESLLPNHRNVRKALNGSLFGDRFRVQVSDRPSTTITSHISKDGHYYIHPDPTQCRSLTVREAARLQTFPDNYFFCGPRTSQYIQVGNAVPPFLAHQIAGIVEAILIDAGIC